MMLLKLLSCVDRERWEPSVVTLQDRGTVGAGIEKLDIPVHTLEIAGSLPGPRAVWRLQAHLKRAKPQLIQGWMYHGNLAALVAGLLAPGHPPVVWGIRSTVYDFRVDGWITAAVVRLGAVLSRRAKRIVYNSRIGASQHAELGYWSAQSLVIPNGFDTTVFSPSSQAGAAFRQRLGIRADAVLIGRVARYHPMKDYDTFLQSAAILSQDNPNTRFVLAGSGVDSTNASLVRQIGALGLENIVHAIGETRPINDMLSALDVACSSSAYGEGFPNVLGEAMSCGVPCVTTDVGDSAWIVGDCGLVVPPRDPQALAVALRTLIDAGTNGRKSMGANARARIVREFSLQNVTKQFEALYDEVAAT